jgi:hypothetical protein
MKARAGSRTFEDSSWNGVVAKAVATVRGHGTTASERIAAARQLARGSSVVIAGLILKPEGSRD